MAYGFSYKIILDPSPSLDTEVIVVMAAPAVLKGPLLRCTKRVKIRVVARQREEERVMMRFTMASLGLMLAGALLMSSGCVAVKASGAYALYEHGSVDSEKAALLADYRKCVEAGAPDCQRFAPNSTTDVHVVATDK